MESSFKTFQDMLTGYRTTQVMLTAYEKGVFDVISGGVTHAQGICRATGMDIPYGTRFLHVLASMGLLELHDGGFALSDFSRKYLIKGASHDQTRTLEFEKRLFESWETLSETLSNGHRVYGTPEKNEADYASSLDLYLDAMDNAAQIRAKELWDSIEIEEQGVILDSGAGSGAFLKEFLIRHSGWRGIFCDLGDVIEKAEKGGVFKGLEHCLEYVAANLLSTKETGYLRDHVRADVLLMSNIIHCQGREETESILDHVLPGLEKGGQLIIHDFFTDANPEGSLYDLHMMVNTYNGRTYSTSETTGMVSRFGLAFKTRVDLPSRSTALVFS